MVGISNMQDWMSSRQFKLPHSGAKDEPDLQ